VPSSFWRPTWRTDEALTEDLESCFGAAFTTSWSFSIANEAVSRTVLRRGLERPPGESVVRKEEAGSIRAGWRVRWQRNALVQAREWVDEESFEWLVAAMCLCVGIESLVVLRDVYGLEAEELARCGLRASPGKS
jgi:hypothetical protein